MKSRTTWFRSHSTSSSSPTRANLRKSSRIASSRRHSRCTATIFLSMRRSRGESPPATSSPKSSRFRLIVERGFLISCARPPARAAISANRAISRCRSSSASNVSTAMKAPDKTKPGFRNWKPGFGKPPCHRSGRSASGPSVRRARGFALAHLGKHRLARQLDAVLVVHCDHLDLHAVSLLAHIAHRFDIAIRELTDVAQPVLAGDDFDEGAEILDGADDPVVDFPDLDFFS